jgi:hypothetical protein
MANRQPESRFLLLRVVLLVCVPLCCCRVGELAALFIGGADQRIACSVQENGMAPSCCLRNAGEASRQSEAPADRQIPIPDGCKDFCCIKAFTPTPPVTVRMTTVLADALPVLTAPSLPAGIGQPVVTSHGERAGQPPPATLLRLRCALLI